jgi:MarR family transcriptional regulator for hemolysin
MIFDREPLTRLIGLASGIHFKTQRIAERRLKGLGLTYPQFGALAAVAEQEGRSQRELAQRLETDANTLMVVCDALQKKGLVERKADPADRRIRRIVLTPRGARVCAEALGLAEQLYRPLLRILPEGQIRKALPALQRLYAELRSQEQA